MPALYRSMFLCFVLMLAHGCSKQVDIKKNKASVVRVQNVESQSIQEKLSLTGTIEPNRVARLGSPAEGPVLNLTIKEGDIVKTGQVLCAIGRTSSLLASHTAAREQYNNEKLDLKRIERLVKSGAIAGEELDRVKTRVAKAAAILKKATEVLGDYKIKAPWEGMVRRVMVSDGEFVAPRQILVEMFDPESLVLRFALPEKNALQIKMDQQAIVHFDSIPGKTFAAGVIRIYPELDPTLRTRTVEAKIKNKDVKLLPGMFVRLELVLATVENALVVPKEAVLSGANGESSVFVVEGSKAKRKPIRLGIVTKTLVQVVEGLSLGEPVIVAGNEGLKDGASVIPVSKNNSSAAKN